MQQPWIGTEKGAELGWQAAESIAIVQCSLAYKAIGGPAFPPHTVGAGPHTSLTTGLPCCKLLQPNTALHAALPGA